MTKTPKEQAIEKIASEIYYYYIGYRPKGLGVLSKKQYQETWLPVAEAVINLLGLELVDDESVDYPFDFVMIEVECDIKGEHDVIIRHEDIGAWQPTKVKKIIQRNGKPVINVKDINVKDIKGEYEKG